MSLLDRRQFLTGGIFASATALSTQVFDITMQPDQYERLRGLEEYLSEKNPDIERNIINNVAKRYDDFAPSLLRPALAGGASAGVYAFLGTEENSHFNKFLYAFAADGVASTVGGVAVDITSVSTIRNDIADLTKSLSSEQSDKLAKSIHTYLESKIIGSPAWPAALITAFGKEHAENKLDQLENNM